jgi:DNA (cytosine-5)-methyltransferase 1
MNLTHFSLFTGIGGIDLAAEWAGFETVGQCEWADYPTKVLEKHWPDVPKWRDIRSVTAENFYERTGLRTVELISGGFPCQPFSVAGKQKGEEDDRYLWPEMLRVIQELQPTWVIGENVPGIVNMALDQVLSDLESQDYEIQTFLIPACGVEALHKRERVFIIAHSNNSKNRTQGVGAHGQRQKKDEGWRKQPQCRVSGLCENVANAHNQGLERWNSEILRECSSELFAGESSAYVPDTSGRRYGLQEEQIRTRGNSSKHGNGWDTEPDVGRVANGIPNRVDRIKCLGNAVVPQQVYPILQAIADIERSCHE